jgi:YXWGXW repeat-containing protein
MCPAYDRAMRSTLRIAGILCALIGTADAGHGGGGGGGPVVRDHRAGGGGGGGGGGPVVRDHRAGGGGGPMVRDHRAGGPVAAGRGPAVRDHREPAHVRVSNGRYVFPGGVVRVYRRPVIHEHYYNVHMRPPVIVESYQPVPGYIWVGGGWAWGGAEWVWNPGYFAEEAAPDVGAGVSVSAGFSIN